MSTSRLSALLVSSFALLLPACGVPDTGAAAQALNDSRDSDDDRHTPAPTNIPPGLAVGANEKLKLRLGAEGVQIYTCTAPTATTGYAWVFKAPEANLFDERARFAGSHFLGPTWQYKDGSKITGVVKARATVDATAIPWLLLTATSTGLPGKLAEVTSIQRVSTSGGLAPATGCDAAHVGAEARVPYTADYYFYVLR